MRHAPNRPAPDFNSAAAQTAINGLRSAARSAMVDGDGTAVLRAIRQIEDMVPATNDIRRRLYNSLMADSIDFGCLPGIDYLLGKSQTGYASGMAHAAHIDQLDSFNHFVAKAAAEGEKLPDIDLEITLVMAAEHGSHGIMAALLDMGVNPRIHNDRPLHSAIERYKSDGFEPVEALLRHGAGLQNAKTFAAEIFPGDSGLAGKIAQFAPRQKAEQAEAVKALPSAGKEVGRDVVAPPRAAFRHK